MASSRIMSYLRKPTIINSKAYWRSQSTTSIFRDKTKFKNQDMPRLVDMKQGNKVSPVFSKNEFESRLKKLRDHMVEQKINGVVLTSYHNINYYTGFLYCSFNRKYACVVTPDQCVTISAGIDGGQPWRRSAYDNITYTDWHKGNYFDGVKRVLGSSVGKLGLEFDHVTLETKAAFDDLYPSCEKVDVGRSLMRQRMIKSPEEQALIRNGARIADIGGTAIAKCLKEGIPEHEVALASTQAMIRDIANTYPDVELLDTWTWFQSGINTDGAHNPVTTRKVQKGDILSLNCFPMIAGYYTALERTMFLDHASDEYIRLWEINCDVHRRGIELLKPGAKCCDIAAELNDIYRKHDLLKYRSFGYGHSFGSLCHYYGREADLELREDIDTVLEPNMVVSMEPMIMIPEGLPGAGGYREHDILVINETGAEDITGFPFGPEHNIIKN